MWDFFSWHLPSLCLSPGRDEAHNFGKGVSKDVVIITAYDANLKSNRLFPASCIFARCSNRSSPDIVSQTRAFCLFRRT